ncbi:MAG: translation initiation factor IF-2 [Chloroflexi bacterium HGW-Chloroflexi-3]|nr:MAG: translation initiation factor IF-2 [Chloroflexi bacterium HGW-Chloroflexi-3]
MSEKNKTIVLPNSITVRDLAQVMETSPIQVIKVLMANGVMANINQQVDFDTAAIVASELGFEAIAETYEEEEIVEVGEIPMWRRMIMDENPKELVNRPPVVTILGHVDHGKTTLLDAIRHTDVAGGEAGGITQHIGAYQIEHKGQLITFLDTPGHAAFTAMRSRGAQGADIVILVVAADDGVMPQTKEAIAHAKAARVPIIVALNKIDRPDANPEFAKRQLSENGLVPDDWDGDTMIVPVSAKQRTGIEDLLEAILLTAEGMSIKANPNGKKIGTIIEAEIDKSKGVMATLLIQNGTVNAGDIVVAGSSYGRIRAMFDYKNKPIRKAGPSTPILIMGMNDVPQAGDIFQVVGSTKEAMSIVTERKIADKDSRFASPKATLEELFSRVQSGEEKELRLIIKADVQGSLEPIMNSLNDLASKEISINILHAETGNISENDVMLASASTAIIVGFNVTADAAAKRMAEGEGVSIRLYQIIYRLIEDVEKALKGMLEPEYVEVIIGKAEVLAIFKIQKIGAIAGCKITAGEFKRNAKARIVRKEEVFHEGEISSLKHEKDDVREVRTGFECGIGLKGFSDFEVGDTILCFTKELSTES